MGLLALDLRPWFSRPASDNLPSRFRHSVGAGMDMVERLL